MARVRLIKLTFKRAGVSAFGAKGMHGMTRKFAVAGAAALSLALGIGGASQAASGSLQARVQAAYDAQCKDLVADDFAAFTKTLNPNFSASVDGRTVTRDDVVLQLQAFAAQGRVGKCSTTVESVQESSNVIIATVSQHISGTLSDGTQTAPVEIDFGKRDMWSDDPGGLEQTTSVNLWSLTYVNGQLRSQTGTPPSTPPLTVPAPSPT